MGGEICFQVTEVYLIFNACQECPSVRLMLRELAPYLRKLISYTVKPPNNGTPRSGQTLYNSQTGWNGISFYTCNTFRNSEKRLTLYSEQRSKPQTPNCKTSIIFPPTSGQVKPHPIIIRLNKNNSDIQLIIIS